MSCYLRATPAGIEVHTPYDHGFVADFKRQIPATGRKWDPAGKVWIVAPQHGDTVAQLIAEYFSRQVDVPTARAATPETKMIKLEYLGAAKDRGDGTMSAFGYVDGGWNVIFPLPVLQNWFCIESRPNERPTLYGVLGIKSAATPDEIKKAFRRLAKQWHPDVASDQDAAEQFRSIKAAYDVLSDSVQRARYEAGLQLASLTPDQALDDGTRWRPPLRCGWLLVESVPQVGRHVVQRILQWEDITKDGKTMTSYWPYKADMFEVRWI